MQVRVASGGGGGAVSLNLGKWRTAVDSVRDGVKVYSALQTRECRHKGREKVELVVLI